jgi:hypothetical protein
VRISDYWNAFVCGARGRGTSAATVPAEILLARFRYGLGPRLYSLYRLWRKSRVEWGDYIDDHRNKPWMHRLNPSGRRYLLDDKLAFFQHCVSSDLATVPIVGLIQSADAPRNAPVPEIASPAMLATLLARHPDGLFFKPAGGSHGEGAFSALPRGTGVSYRGIAGTVSDLLAYCRSHAADHEGRLIVQPRLRPARALLKIMSPHGLGTVRAVTCLDGERVRLLAASLRIPVGGNDADNFLHGASGNLVAAIDTDTGRLMQGLGSARLDWPVIVPVERHPDTGTVIEGFQLPFWAQLVDLVARGQRAFTGLQTIGWDVAITDSGPVLIEGNGAYDTDLLQITHDRGFRPTLLAAMRTASTSMAGPRAGA